MSHFWGFKSFITSACEAVHFSHANKTEAKSVWSVSGIFAAFHLSEPSREGFDRFINAREGSMYVLGECHFKCVSTVTRHQPILLLAENYGTSNRVNLPETWKEKAINVTRSQSPNTPFWTMCERHKNSKWGLLWIWRSLRFEPSLEWIFEMSKVFQWHIVRHAGYTETAV